MSLFNEPLKFNCPSDALDKLNLQKKKKKNLFARIRPCGTLSANHEYLIVLAGAEYYCIFLELTTAAESSSLE